MNFTINEELKKELFNNIYLDFAKCETKECWDIPHFYTIILVNWLENKKRVFHIESEEELDFFVKNFAYRDIIYIMQSPWRNRKEISTRYDTDCIVGVIYKEFLEEFDNNEFKYFNAVCTNFGVENYGDDNNPWEEQIAKFIS